jgi:hypothetical protein
MFRIFKNENGRKFKTLIPRVGKSAFDIGKIKSLAIADHQQENVIDSAWRVDRSKPRNYAAF